MPSSPTYERLHEGILEEHKQIHFYLDQVLRTLETLDAEPENVEPMRRLAAQLDSLGERLLEHRQIEEQEGLYAAILDRPAQIAMLPGLLILVPGSVGFRSIRSLMGAETVGGIEAAFQVIIIGVALVVGLLLANAIVRPRKIL